MQIRTAEMPFLTCQAKTQKLDNTLYWQSYGEAEIRIYCCGNAKQYSPCGGEFGNATKLHM